MKRILKKVIAKFTLTSVKIVYKNINCKYNKSIAEPLLIKFISCRHKKAVKKLKDKDKIKVAFFALYSSVWKYDELYKLMSKHISFEPIIIVCPIINNGIDYMIAEMERTFQIFKDKNYNVVKAYNTIDKTYLDVKKIIKPDIIFYTNPYRGLTNEKYYINRFIDTLTCYVPYAIMTTNYKEFYDLDFHNLLWKIFCETTIHKEIASSIQRIKGRNMVVTGYPGCDRLVSKNTSYKDVWKNKSRKIKRIIWAPHHLMNEMNRMSNFLEYCYFFLEIAQRYKDKIQIAFKPHPLLRIKLEKDSNWGIEKTDIYYEKWKNLENGQLECSDYIDLFLSSDALIHDSGSFITEYLITGKPSLFMVRDEKVMKQWSKYGDMALAVHYQSRNSIQVINFIEDVVINEKDWMKSIRYDFLNKVTLPPNGLSASENILKFLESELL